MFDVDAYEAATEDPGTERSAIRTIADTLLVVPAAAVVALFVAVSYGAAVWPLRPRRARGPLPTARLLDVN